MRPGFIWPGTDMGLRARFLLNNPVSIERLQVHWRPVY